MKEKYKHQLFSGKSWSLRVHSSTIATCIACFLDFKRYSYWTPIVFFLIFLVVYFLFDCLKIFLDKSIKPNECYDCGYHSYFLIKRKDKKLFCNDCKYENPLRLKSANEQFCCFCGFGENAYYTNERFKDRGDGGKFHRHPRGYKNGYNN